MLSCVLHVPLPDGVEDEAEGRFGRPCTGRRSGSPLGRAEKYESQPKPSLRQSSLPRAPRLRLTAADILPVASINGRTINEKVGRNAVTAHGMPQSYST
jgi:hypothetical protein